MTRLRIATRASAQARTQAQQAADAITAAHPHAAVELVLVETTGDRRRDVPLHVIGGQGVFVKEVQRAVLDGRADIAAHSAKDLPSSAEDGLDIVAFCARRDPRDALVGTALSDLALGAMVATGSVRRQAQLASLRPDLSFVELRGNIATRLSKVPRGGAIVMAMAALEVLGITDEIASASGLHPLPVPSGSIGDEAGPATFVPAVGQGCVAVECRSGDAAVAELVASIDDAAARRSVMAERRFLAELGSGCSLPVGAYAPAGTGVLYTFLAGERATSRATVAIDDAEAAARRARARVA